MVLPRHAHEHACINFVLAGVYDERLPGVSGQHGSLGLVFKPAWAEHANHFEHGGARCVLIELLERDQADPGLELDSPAESRDPRDSRLALEIWRELVRHAGADALAIESLVHELFGQVLGRSSATRSSERRSPRLCRVTDLLHDDPGAPWTLSRLAAEVGFHPSHLARAFRARHGITVGAYLRELRVTEAGRRLALGEEPIAAIALGLGFADQSHLTRAFRRRMGRPPAAFRRAFDRARHAIVVQAGGKPGTAS